MKFRESKLDVSRKVVVALVVLAILVVIGALIARLTRDTLV